MTGAERKRRAKATKAAAVGIEPRLIRVAFDHRVD
jgi:hypothetical protein